MLRSALCNRSPVALPAEPFFLFFPTDVRQPLQQGSCCALCFATGALLCSPPIPFFLLFFLLRSASLCNKSHVALGTLQQELLPILFFLLFFPAEVLKSLQQGSCCAPRRTVFSLLRCASLCNKAPVALSSLQQEPCCSPRRRLLRAARSNSDPTAVKAVDTQRVIS